MKTDLTYFAMFARRRNILGAPLRLSNELDHDENKVIRNVNAELCCIDPCEY